MELAIHFENSKFIRWIEENEMLNEKFVLQDLLYIWKAYMVYCLLSLQYKLFPFLVKLKTLCAKPVEKKIEVKWDWWICAKFH